MKQGLQECFLLPDELASPGSQVCWSGSSSTSTRGPGCAEKWKILSERVKKKRLFGSWCLWSVMFLILACWGRHFSSTCTGAHGITQCPEVESFCPHLLFPKSLFFCWSLLPTFISLCVWKAQTVLIGLEREGLGEPNEENKLWINVDIDNRANVFVGKKASLHLE